MSNAIMAILFEGKKDLVDDVRLDRAEVIAAAAVDAAWGRRWCSRAVHHREYSICLTISVIPRDHPCIFLSIFIYYLFVLQACRCSGKAQPSFLFKKRHAV